MKESDPSPAQPSPSDGMTFSAEGANLHFDLPNDTALFCRIADTVREHLTRLLGVEHQVALELITALEESLANAVIHGNLEVCSDLRHDPDQYQELIDARRSKRPYSTRRVRLRVAVIPPNYVEFHVRDEGPGFQPDTIPDPRAHEDGFQAWGNGLLIIRSFMDEVRHNDRGNEITMSRRLG